MPFLSESGLRKPPLAQPSLAIPTACQFCRLSRIIISLRIVSTRTANRPGSQLLVRQWLSPADAKIFHGLRKLGDLKIIVISIVIYIAYGIKHTSARYRIARKIASLTRFDLPFFPSRPGT